jgi:hypothetical protein
VWQFLGASERQLPVQVEQNGPVLSAQIAKAKAQLASMIISDAAYQEVLSIPPERRSLADEVRMCMHESLLQLKQENETLRLSAQARHRCLCLLGIETWPRGVCLHMCTGIVQCMASATRGTASKCERVCWHEAPPVLQASREAQQKSADEAASLQRANAQLRASVASAQDAASSDAGSRDAQMERLKHDLRQASMAAEVNQAKADVYDELNRHAKDLEAQNRNLLAAEATRGAIDHELTVMQEAHRVHLNASLRAASHASRIISPQVAWCERAMAWTSTVTRLHAPVTTSFSAGARAQAGAADDGQGVPHARDRKSERASDHVHGPARRLLRAACRSQGAARRPVPEAHSSAPAALRHLPSVA